MVLGPNNLRVAGFKTSPGIPPTQGDPCLIKSRKKSPGRDLPPERYRTGPLTRTKVAVACLDSPFFLKRLVGTAQSSIRAACGGLLPYIKFNIFQHPHIFKRSCLDALKGCCVPIRITRLFKKVELERHRALFEALLVGWFRILNLIISYPSHFRAGSVLKRSLALHIYVKVPPTHDRPRFEALMVRLLRILN